MEEKTSKQPLSGLKVIAVENYFAGPYCSMILADAGAEVIKIERPGCGDSSRMMDPIIEDQSGRKTGGGYLRFNRNKKSLSLDLKREKGREIFKELIKTADVVIENFRPGFMEELSLGYDVLKEINPKHIYCKISGFGTNGGPYSKRPAFDIIIQAMSGLMDQIGYPDRPPVWAGIALADIYSGRVAASGILLALYNREKTGQGDFIDISMYDNLISLNERAIVVYSLTGEKVERGPHSHMVPTGAFKAKDGYVAFLVPVPEVWKRLCRAMGKEELIDDPRFAKTEIRFKNLDVLTKIIEGWMHDKTREEVVNIFLNAGLPAGPVQTSVDLLSCPQVKGRNILMELSDPVVGKFLIPDEPVKIKSLPKTPNNPPPQLGENTEEILRSYLNLGSEEINILKEDKVISFFEDKKL